MLRIEVKLGGLGSLLKRLTNLKVALDTIAILDEIGAMLLNRIRARFLAETDSEGTQWPESKAAQARRAGGGTGTLYETGHLFRSVQLAAKGADYRIIGTDVPYGKFHQFGTRLLPRRSFLGVNDEDARLAEALLQHRIERFVGALA